MTISRPLLVKMRTFLIVLKRQKIKTAESEIFRANVSYLQQYNILLIFIEVD